jgi:hypothetical protein
MPEFAINVTPYERIIQHYEYEIRQNPLTRSVPFVKTVTGLSRLHPGNPIS